MPMQTCTGIFPRSYLNNAATPQIAKPVIKDCLQRLPCYAYDNESNTISRNMKAAYHKVREIVLQYIGGDPQRGHRHLYTHYHDRHQPIKRHHAPAGPGSSDPHNPAGTRAWCSDFLGRGAIGTA